MATPTVWDMHVHLDFMRNLPDVTTEAERLGVGLFAVTVEPDGYARAQEELRDAPWVCLGAGLHPWWVADGRCDEEEVSRTLERIGQTRYVGEIGLDLSPKHVPEGSFDRQLHAFEAIAETCAATSDANAPKVLSIHSVQSAGLALDVLERTGVLASCNCIFHWFSGTSDELHRAVRSGCRFSINEMMLRTRRGREYARQLPANRLLLETDLPPGEDVPFTASQIRSSLMRTAEQLAQIRGVSTDDITTLTQENSFLLLG